jgi:glutathione S-transferase
MPLDFYYLSGSPFAWKVWLALEHKQIPYTLHVLSVDAGDLKKPAYRAINPHCKVPAIVHEGFVLYGSSAIVEYLEEAFPDSGAPLWPAGLQLRAVGRRLAAEAEGYRGRRGRLDGRNHLPG